MSKGKQEKFAKKPGICVRCQGPTELQEKGTHLMRVHIASGRRICPIPLGVEGGRSARDLMDFDAKDPHQSTLAARRQAVLGMLRSKPKST
jgi:hypothetical protein